MQVLANITRRINIHFVVTDSIEKIIAYLSFTVVIITAARSALQIERQHTKKTMEREKLLIEAGFKVTSMWECEWQTLKKTLPNKKALEQEAKEQKIRVRDALFGGRAEAFKKMLNVLVDRKYFITMS